MEFKEPFVVYIAETNLEAQLIVRMLHAHDIPALADEDSTHIGLWIFGTISQLHKPKIWVEKSTTEKALQLIHTFEQTKQQRRELVESEEEIAALCEECGKVSQFSATYNGTVQECPHCRAYVDVGDLDWEDDFGEPEEP